MQHKKCLPAVLVIPKTLVLLQFRTPTSSSLAGCLIQSLTIPVTRTTARSHLSLRLHCQRLIPKSVRFISLCFNFLPSFSAKVKITAEN